MKTIFGVINIVREVKKKKKKHFDGFNPQWGGGGGFGPNPLFTYFFYF